MIAALGLGRMLVERLTAEARAMGYERMRLDAVESAMKDAIALYRKLGFHEIKSYTAIPIGPRQLRRRFSCAHRRHLDHKSPKCRFDYCFLVFFLPIAPMMSRVRTDPRVDLEQAIYLLACYGGVGVVTAFSSFRSSALSQSI